ncbi:MAG: gamma-glutamyltransferase, partial [Bryobacter sp.]|nr:gamma-glutamyltransferase [Bryobacter sp.]
MRRRLFLLLIPALAGAQEVSQSGLRLQAARPMVAQPLRAEKVMVASVHELATDAGLAMLRKGGNAVDAAVAVAFALGVVHPEAGNLGGSGYAMVHLKGQKTTAFDYIGAAPTGSKPGMFANDREGNLGYKSISIPGTVAGMGLMHQRYGKLKWATCLEPARKLAAQGFPASQRLELILKLNVPVMKPYAETAKVFLHGSDRPVRQGEIVKQPELAATIARIQKKGWREFYTGETARRLVADMQANKGLLTAEDLKNYEAKEIEPLKVMYRDHPVLTMGPSSSGGIAVAVSLNVLNRYPLALGREGSVMTRHLQIEAMRRGARARLEGVAALYANTAELISPAYAERAAADLSLDQATPARTAAPPKESNDTTHFSIIDADGNMVANTYTLSGFFGSQVIAKGTGVLLNNHMSVFSGPGSRTAQRILKPGVRYPSTMSPTLILKPDGSPWVALGTPGAATIPSTIFQVVSNLIDFKMSLRDAIEFPR